MFQGEASRFPGYCITVGRRGWTDNQTFRYSRFSFRVMWKILLEFYFFIYVRYIICF